MPTVDVYNADGKVVGNMDLNENVFGVTVRSDVMHEVVVNYLANQRRAPRAQEPERKYAAAALSPGDKRGPAVPVKAVSAPRSGLAAVLHSAPSPEITDTL